MWGIVLEKNKDISLARQIYLSLRQSMLSGQITQGEVMPSTRELAKGLGVSRNTVSVAYDMLWAEGYIIRSQGAPTRVAEGLLICVEQQNEKQKQKENAQYKIKWDFITGQPDLSAFPWSAWQRMVSDATGRLTHNQFAYSGSKGYEPLCEQIAGWLLRSRSMQVNPEDVFITSGATQALHLLVEILNKPNTAFALENPSHPGIRTVIMDKGSLLCWMTVDDKGADIGSLWDKALSAVYVTPSHQFPLGAVLPATRRADLIRLAAEKKCYIIEDDYDSEFRYGGSSITPIYSMDPSRVVYVGTFSKTVFPAIRLGFAVLPKALQKRWKHFRQFMDVQNPILDQAVLAEFLRSRKMDKHVQKMRRIYGEKREVLLRCVQEAFEDKVIPWGDASGLHVSLQFPGECFSETFIDACKNAGIRVSALSKYCADPNQHRDKLLLGYGHLNDTQIREGITVIASMTKRGADLK